MDTQNATVRLNGSAYAIAGLAPDVQLRLALEGLKHLLTKAKNREAKWSRIQAGNFSRKTGGKVPMMVRVLARLTMMPEERAAADYAALTDQEKKAFRRDPNVRAMRYRILAEDVTKIGSSRRT